MGYIPKILFINYTSRCSLMIKKNFSSPSNNTGTIVQITPVNFLAADCTYIGSCTTSNCDGMYCFYSTAIYIMV
jgi:hypothetical protein